MLNNITDEQLRDMYYGKGMRYKEIAKAIGCSAPAVCMRMKQSGIKAKRPWDYEPTEKQKASWKQNGERLAKLPVTEEARRKISKARKGTRKRQDYEFGGHEKTRKDGYIKVYCPDHPAATKDGYVMKHRLVMELEIGRYLTGDEAVHHVNHNRADNRLENLRLMTKHDHMSMHMKERWEEKRRCSM